MTNYKRRSHLLILVIIAFLMAMPTATKGNATAPVIAQVADKAPIVQIQNQSLQLAAKAKSLYQAGKWKEAADVWQKTANAFATAGDKTNQAMALSNLSLTYQQLGNWQAAQQAITTSLNLLKTSGQSQQRILAQTHPS
ncbi:tetratricopeptide repeat protein [Nostoc sp. CHAB 5836]|uniref:tetratricopeptide repeat protein n=1 Tax=Nostoc sp. CHAB 5836 TaxID=2780404 RepID=UPI001E443A92|nr:tetratricopeptide repeat protein [Nostoc sp. CHAB 5836]MCC5613753.1 tetratricopeptide repeat protein [Nostoc sp. CHAB 5836]